MKFSFILMLFSLLHATASVYSQTATISLGSHNATIADVFNAIEQQTEYKIFYKNDQLDITRLAGIKSEKVMVKDALAQMFRNSDCSYTMFDKLIVVTPKVDVHQQGITVTGTIKDEEQMPMPGVNVTVKGTTLGVVTDIDGSYSINVPNENAVLVFSFIGYAKHEYVVGNQRKIDIVLAESTREIEEVVVIGYGTMKKSDLTGAIGQIDPSKNPSKITSNATDLLKNSVPGLNMPMPTDAKGGVDMANVMIRGQNSIKASNTPLIILDGMVYGGDLANISSHDIERIDVLKDASSAAIYGSRASNGVIIITTKKGRKGTPTINVSVNTGLVTTSFLRPIYSPEGYINMRQTMYGQNVPRPTQPGYYDNPSSLPSGVTMDQWMGYSGSTGNPEEVWLQRLYFQPTEIKNYKAGKTVDWEKELFQTGLRQDYAANISGGTDKIQYFGSVNYTDNEGFVVGNEYSSFRARLNVENKIADFLSVGVNAQYSNRDESAIAADWKQYSVLSPYGSIYEDDGKTLKLYVHDDNGSANPFLSMTYNDRYNKFSNLSMNMYATVFLPLGFTYQFNYINIIGSGRTYDHTSSKNPSNTSGGYASRLNNNTYYWSVENMIKWNKTFGKHNFDVTLMANAEKDQSWVDKMENSKFVPSDGLGYHAMALGGNPIISSTDAVWTRDALLGRLNYTFNSKYFLTVALRRDGYSAFGQDNPYAYFPTSAVAWKISEEGFFNIEPINFLKLRMSYGANGNSAIDPYDALASMGTEKYLLANPNGTAYSITALTMSRLSNRELQWEKTTAYNFGLDFGLFKDRITGSLDAYFSKTTNLLINRSLPRVTGFSSVSSNMGQVNNHGFEIIVNSNNMYIDKKFSWNTNFNAYLNRNKIVHLYGDKDANGNEVDDVTNKWFIGHGLDAIWDYIPDGVWQVEDTDLAYSYGGYLPGEYRMIDKNKDGQYTEVVSGDWRLGDKDFIGYSKPRFQWNMVNNFTLFEQFTFSFTVYGFHGYKGGYLQQAGNERTSTYDLPYWTEENRSNKWMRTQVLSANSRPMSHYFNLDFVRISDISVGYTVPNRITQLFKVENLNIVASVKNAFLFTGWPGWDPENTGGPVPRYFNLSINVKL